MSRRLTPALTVLLSGFLMWFSVSEAPVTRTLDAYARAYQFEHCVNYRYKNAGLIYDLLTRERQQRITRDDFIAAFEKERSYPYLTPLFFHLESVQMGADSNTAEARFSQAARLPGMFTTLTLRYGEDGYRVDAFEELADGSYLQKFERLKVLQPGQ